MIERIQRNRAERHQAALDELHHELASIRAQVGNLAWRHLFCSIFVLVRSPLPRPAGCLQIEPQIADTATQASERLAADEDEISGLLAKTESEELLARMSMDEVCEAELGNPIPTSSTSKSILPPSLSCCLKKSTATTRSASRSSTPSARLGN